MKAVPIFLMERVVIKMAILTVMIVMKVVTMLGLIDNEELSGDTDTDLEVVENDVLQLQSTGYKIVGDNIDKIIRASF